MEEPIFDPVSRRAGMRRKAFVLNDTTRAISNIETGPLPEATTTDRLNRLLTDHWRAVTRAYSNQEFIDKVLTPLQETYGAKIVTLEQLGEPGVPWK